MAENEGLRLQEGDASRASVQIRVFRLLVRLLFAIFFRVRVRGVKNVPREPAIVCANHLGWTDPFLVLLYFPVEPRIYVVGEREVAQIAPWRTRMIDWMQLMVALDRDKPREA